MRTGSTQAIVLLVLIVEFTTVPLKVQLILRSPAAFATFCLVDDIKYNQQKAAAEDGSCLNAIHGFILQVEPVTGVYHVRLHGDDYLLPLIIVVIWFNLSGGI